MKYKISLSHSVSISLCGVFHSSGIEPGHFRSNPNTLLLVLDCAKGDGAGKGRLGEGGEGLEG